MASEEEQKETVDDFAYLWSVINSPYRAGRVWATYKRETIDESVKRLKRVMEKNGFFFKPE